MAASLRLSAASTIKALPIQGLTPKNIGSVTPKGVRGAPIQGLTPKHIGTVTPKGLLGGTSPFHLNLERATPKSNRGYHTSSSACFTPKSPSNVTATRFCIGMPAREEVVTSTISSIPVSEQAYPRLLGRRSSVVCGGAQHSLPTSTIAEAQRCVRFNEGELAESARSAYLARQGVRASRRLPQQSQ